MLLWNHTVKKLNQSRVTAVPRDSKIALWKSRELDVGLQASTILSVLASDCPLILESFLVSLPSASPWPATAWPGALVLGKLHQALLFSASAFHPTFLEPFLASAL